MDKEIYKTIEGAFNVLNNEIDSIREGYFSGNEEVRAEAMAKLSLLMLNEMLLRAKVGEFSSIVVKNIEAKGAAEKPTEGRDITFRMTPMADKS